tara:strand:- start:1254 stop:2525 length:1272 start_codon:yes stop_codon:yes gene_type:complete
MSKPSFAISCPFDTYSGYGARSRDIIKAIIELDQYDVKLLPQRWGDTPTDFCKDHKEWMFLWDHSTQQLTEKPDIWMQITIPNEFQKVGKFNIGCTAGIESTGCDKGWVEGLNRMDMNWVSSNHSKKVFESVSFENKHPQTQQPMGTTKLEKPIYTIFEGVNLDVYKYLKPSEVKLDLTSIKESFCYLFVGHWMQGDFGHDRKNVGATVKYFFDAFKNQSNPPALILKASTGRNSYIGREALLDKINIIKRSYKKSIKLPNVYLLNGNLSDTEMNELYNHPKVKAMVSLTKGEGYGRPLSEFCLSKKPIIVSGWSGHMDFIDPTNSIVLPGNLENVHASAANKWLLKETQWFQVGSKNATDAFKDVKNKYKNYAVGGKKQGFKIKSEFSWESMKQLISETLKNVPEFPKEIKLSLPQLQTPKL